MKVAKIVFLAESGTSYKPMGITFNVEQIESGELSNSLRYKILDNFNDLSPENLKKLDYYINSGFFGTGTLQIDNKIFTGNLTLSIENKILGILTNDNKILSLNEDSFIFDLRI